MCMNILYNDVHECNHVKLQCTLMKMQIQGLMRFDESKKHSVLHDMKVGNFTVYEYDHGLSKFPPPHQLMHK